MEKPDKKFLESAGQENFFLSSQIMSGEKTDDVLNQVKQGKKINILGASHSAFVSILALFEKAKEMNIEIPKGAIRIIKKQNSNINIFFESRDVAKNSGFKIVTREEYDNNKQKDPKLMCDDLHYCKMQRSYNRFGGVRPPARQIALDVLNEKEDRVIVQTYPHSDNDGYDEIQDEFKGNVNVQAIGFQPTMIELVDSSGKIIDPKNVVTNSASRLSHRVRSTIYPNAHTIGAVGPMPIHPNTGGEKGYRGGGVAVQFYRNQQAPTILQQVLQ